MIYQRQSKTVLYRSKMNPLLKKNFAVFTVLDWIATLTAHIPDEGEQLIRYYGYYSNVSRGKRKKEKPEDKNEIREVDAPPLSRELKKRWSDLFWISDFGFPIMGPREKERDSMFLMPLFLPNRKSAI
jgi:hypothetical protein